VDNAQSGSSVPAVLGKYYEGRMMHFIRGLFLNLEFIEIKTLTSVRHTFFQKQIFRAALLS